MRHQILRFGGQQVRVGSWRGDPRTGYLAPLVAPGSLTSPTVEAALDVLARQGFRSVVTSALGTAERGPFERLGFDELRHLHLLGHDLASVPAAPPVRTRRMRRSERSLLLAIDNEAFEPFWRLDDESLTEAVEATPRRRIRLAMAGRPVGYAITGLARRAGYIQRLAVRPGDQHGGRGTALVVDALQWARRRGATAVLVNTQTDNVGALTLYERCGFVRRPEGLTVFGRHLDGPR